MSESAPNPNVTNLVGRRLGDYQVLRKLGRGGMADVYAAKHLTLGRDVALKVLRADLARDEDYVGRFRREARAAAKLNDTNIVAVYDVGCVDGLHFIAQELIEGENLREILDRNGPLDPEEAIRVLLSVASALDVACAAGITHRDIKPENIMRSSRGAIKVADFGLARLGVGSDESRADLTQAGLTLGTPRYMSPEQVQGKPVDARSDLYSLGITIYHLLAGKAPFNADEPLALAVMHLHETPEPLDRVRTVRGADGQPDLPEWLVAVISRLMQKSPGDRFQSPGELLDALRNEVSTSSIGGVPMAAGTAAATIRLQRAADAARRNRYKRIAKFAAAVGIPLAVGGATFQGLHRLSEPVEVSRLLHPDTVSKADDVRQQYFVALTRNDEVGWRAVSELFPADQNSTNATYRSKATIQLVRLMIEENRWDEAAAELNGLLADAEVGKLYQLIALTLKCRVHQLKGETEQLSDAKEQLRALDAELTKNDAAAKELYRRVVSTEDRIEFGIID